MASETDRTLLYVLGAGALIWLMTRRAGAVTPARPSGPPVDDPIFTFPPNDPNVDLSVLWCSPFDPFGGWTDAHKVEEATRIYVEKWGFSPTTDFTDAVARRDPCERKDVDKLVNAFPPFPGQSFRMSQLEEKKRRQAEARQAKQAADAQEKKTCEDRTIGASTVVVGGGAAIAAGVVTGGAAAAPAGAAGAAGGAALGRFLSGIWC